MVPVVLTAWMYSAVSDVMSIFPYACNDPEMRMDATSEGEAPLINPISHSLTARDDPFSFRVKEVHLPPVEIDSHFLIQLGF